MPTGERVTKSIYVAGSSRERAAIGEMIRALAAAGWAVTHDWTTHEAWDVDSPAEDVLVSAAQTDLDAVRHADVVWYVTPAVESGKSEGAAVELGAALALGKTVVVSGALDRQRIFPRLADHHFGSHAAAFDMLVSEEFALTLASTLAQRRALATVGRAGVYRKVEAPSPRHCAACHELLEDCQVRRALENWLASARSGRGSHVEPRVVQAALDGRCLAPPGGRHNALCNIASVIAFAAPDEPWAHIEEVVLPAIRATCAHADELTGWRWVAEQAHRRAVERAVEWASARAVERAGEHQHASHDRGVVARHASPRLVHPEQATELTVEVSEVSSGPRWSPAPACTDLQANVLAFHRAVVGDVPEGPVVFRPHVPSDDKVVLRRSLILEETLETIYATAKLEPGAAKCGEAEKLTEQLDAIVEGLGLRAVVDIVAGLLVESEVSVDLVEFADGLADLMYVAEGGFLAFGIDSRGVHAEVQRSNTAKAGGPKNAQGKSMKPPGWTPPDIGGVLRAQGWGGKNGPIVPTAPPSPATTTFTDGATLLFAVAADIADKFPELVAHFREQAALAPTIDAARSIVHQHIRSNSRKYLTPDLYAATDPDQPRRAVCLGTNSAGCGWRRSRGTCACCGGYGTVLAQYAEWLFRKQEPVAGSAQGSSEGVERDVALGACSDAPCERRRTDRGKIAARVTALAARYGMVQGAHHKQWLIDQFLRIVLDDDYAAWRRSEDQVRAAEDRDAWSEGVAP